MFVDVICMIIGIKITARCSIISDCSMLGKGQLSFVAEEGEKTGPVSDACLVDCTCLVRKER